MSPLARALLRLLPTSGTVVLHAGVPATVAAALDHRGVAVVGPDDDGAGEALAEVVLVPAVGADVDVDVASLAAVAALPGEWAPVGPLPDEDGGRGVALVRRTDVGGEAAATALLRGLLDTVDLLAAELEEVGRERDEHRSQAADRGQRLRAAQQATRQAERIVTQLVRELGADDEGDAALAALSRSVLATGGPTARVVAALRGEAARLLPSTVRPDPVLRRAEAPAAGEARGGRVGAPRGPASGVRVSPLGVDAEDLLAGAVRVRPLASDLPARLAAGEPLVPAEGHDHVEALAVGPLLPAGWDTTSAQALVASARDLGVPVLGVRPDPSLPTWFDGLVDVEATAGTDASPPDGPTRVPTTRPVDPVVVAPRGFVRRPTGGYAVVPSGAVPPAAATALRDAAAADGVPLVALLPGDGDDTPVPAGLDGIEAVPVGRFHLDTSEGPAVAARFEAVLTAARGHRAVLDHPGLHPDHHAHAHHLAALALARVPVRLAAPLPAPVRAMLGDAVADALARTSAADLADPVLRELATVRVHRAAWPRLTPAGTWARVGPALGLPAPRATSVSMVLATNRPDHLEHAVRQAASQRWSSRELVVVLHGDAFDDEWPERVHDTAAATTEQRGLPAMPTTVLRADADQMLGPVLDIGCDAAAGDVVTKVDDDDWYSPDHLTDLLAALEASGATLVAKGAEFTYLAEIDLTIRRMADGGESPSRSLAGGTFLLRRDDLRAVGGWPRTPRFVDQRLLDAVAEAGGNWWRGHGFGFVLNRHGTGHTWDAGVDYFLRQAVTQHPGLALDIAGVTD